MLTYKGIEYELKNNFNAMEEIQEEYGSLNEWQNLVDGSVNGEPSLKALKFGICQMINEYIEEYNESADEKKRKLTLKQCGRLISDVGLEEVVKEIHNAIAESSKSDEKN